MMIPISRASTPSLRRAPVGEFGDKFRKAREKKDISLDDVSNVTKISSRMLKAIEEEHFDQLPGGVFNKGFIRAYAKHLGLNDEEAVTDYLACLRQAQIDAQQVWTERPLAPSKPSPPAPAAATPDYQKPNLTAHGQVQVEEELPELHLPRAEDARPPRKGYPDRGQGFSWRFAAVTAVIVVLAAVLWMHHSRSLRTEAAPPARNTLPVAEPRAIETSAAPPAAVPHNPGKSSQPETKTPEKPVPASKSEIQADDRNGGNDVTVRTFPPAKPATAAKATPKIASLKLIIRASQTSWISVTADGQPVTHETLIAPAAISVHASHEIVARIGNSAGITFLFNDQEIPADGTEAEVKTYVFDAQGMRIAPSTPTTSAQ